MNDRSLNPGMLISLPFAFLLHPCGEVPHSHCAAIEASSRFYLPGLHSLFCSKGGEPQGLARFILPTFPLTIFRCGHILTVVMPGPERAGVVKSVDTGDLKSPGRKIVRAGSNPALGIEPHKGA